MSRSSIYMDAGGEGLLHRTAWAGAGDGVLFFDPDGRNDITEKRQYVFTEWDPTAKGDLEAIRSVFDSNGDGKLTAADADFAKFKVMVTNADGSTSVMTLAALGITEIDLSPDATNIRMDDGSVITGQTEFTRSDGSTGTVANTVLVAEAMGHNVEQVESVDGAGVRTVETLAYAADGSLAYGITSVTSADGSSIVNSYDDDGDGAVDRIQVIDTVVNGDGSITETLANYRGAVVATAILVSRKVVTDSADGLVKTIERDSTGGGWFDQREVQTTNGDDSRTVLLEDLAKDGSVIRGYSETISVDGLTRVRSVDEDGDGFADQVTQHVIVINGDGSRDEVVTVLNQDGSVRAEVDEDIAIDGRSKVVARDLDGDGDADTVEVTDISVAGDGSTVSVLDVENGDGSLRSSVTQSQSADTLVKTSASDVDGDGDVDLTVVDATVINGDGSRERVVTASNLDGSVNSMVRETLGADKVTSQTWVDQNQDGVFQATDLVKDVTVDGGTGERTATVWGRNADGSVHSQSVSVTSEDGLTRLTSVDADGDGDTDTEISDVTVIDGAGVSTRTVETRNGDGTLRSSSETVSSADGLSTVTEVDIDGDGVVDGRTEDLRVLNGDGSVTRTVSEYAGDGVTLLGETVTEQSADRRVSTVTVDSDGDGFTDAVVGSVLNEDGSRTVTENTFAPDGAVVGESVTTVSANGLVSVTVSDADGDGTDETVVTEITVLNADGSRTVTRDIDNGNGSDRSVSVTDISDDGLEVAVRTDADGDGSFERTTEAVSVLGADGSVVTSSQVRSADDTVLSETRTTRSDDGLLTVTETDGDGDGDYDLIRETETVLLADGGTEVTSELREADGTLRSSKVVTSSDDGRLVTTGTDVNGDGAEDMVSVRTETNDGTVTLTQEELNADGSLQSRETSSVSDDGLSVVSARDLDGDMVEDRITETETTLGSDGSRTTIVEHKSGDGTIYASSEVTVSDDGLERVSADDWNHDGAIDVTETDTLSIAADGETTRTVVQVAADASVLNTRTIVTSADGRIVVESFDIDGDGNIDREETRVEGDDGTIGVTENIYSHGGVLVGQFTSTISADGLTVTEIRDRNANGLAEFQRVDTTTLRDDGFTEREIINTDGFNVGKASQYFLTSNDGLYQYSELDLDGDGVIESSTEAETVFEEDGDTVTVQVVRDAADADLARVEARTTGNGLVTEIAEDYDGDGSIDRASTLTREADGAWSETVIQYGGGTRLQQSVTETMSADGRTHTVTADLDGDGFEERRIEALTDLSRNVTTTYQDIARDGEVETTITGTHSANGMFTEYAFDIDGDGEVDITRTTELEYLADGSQVETFTETYGNKIVYQEVTTRAADGLSATGTIDNDGDGELDGTTSSVTKLNDDGSSTTVSDVFYSDGDLRSQTVRHVSSDRRETATSMDFDGNGIADKETFTRVNLDGSLYEEEQVFNEGGMPGQIHRTWTSADGLNQSIRRAGDSVQIINNSHAENGSYVWDNGLTAAYGVTYIRVEHEYDGLGIETWTSTEKTKNSNGDAVNNTYTVRIDAAAKQQAISEAARIFDTALDRSMDFTEIEVLVKYIDDGQLNQAQLINALLSSGEFATRFGSMSDAEFITQLSLNTYGRSPSLEELNEQLLALDNGALTRAELALELSESVEHVVVGNGHMSTNNFDVIMNPAVYERSLDEAYVRAQIENLVDVVYDRDATEQELSYLSDRLLSGTDNLDDIAGTLLGIDGDIIDVRGNSLKGMNNAQLVENAYLNAFGRQPTLGEQDAWQDHLNAGRITKAQFVASLAQSVEHLEAGNFHLNHTTPGYNYDEGDDTANTLIGTSNSNALYGLGGDDTLNGLDGSDRLVGGAGDDLLYGGNGNDFYYWSKGDGSDEIWELVSNETESDTLILSDVASTEVTLYRDNTESFNKDDLNILIPGPSGDEVLVILDQFDAPNGGGIERIEFSDGVVWTLKDILEKTRLEGTSSGETVSGQSHIDNIFGLGGDDTLYGNDGDDMLTGGTGEDLLRGGDGADTYIWSRGDGDDHIDDEGMDTTEVDRLILTDVTLDEVQLFKDNDSQHLTVQISGADGGEIFIEHRFQDVTQGDGIEVIEFGDGEVWTLDEMIERSKVMGDGGNNTLTSTKYADSLYGMGGNDTLNGNEGDDLLVGGTGDDTLKGGEGEDRYEWSKGDGNDTIDDNSTSTTERDTLYLLDVDSDDVVLRRVVEGGGWETDEMEIEIISTGEKVIVKNQFENSNNKKGIEAIVFADGEAWYEGDIYRQIITEGSASGDHLDGDGNTDILHGLGGDDTIEGEGGNDVLVGGAGDDALHGDTGNDRFLWSLGDGNDTIWDDGSSQTQRDTLKLLDVASTEVTFAISGSGVGSTGGSDLLVTVVPTGEVITLKQVFLSDDDNVRGVEFIEFSDGVVMEVASSPVAEMTVTGTSGNDTLNGWAYGDVIEGLDGDDTLNGGHGDDTLVGGLGADSLLGGLGSDTYVWSKGDGEEFLDDRDASLEDTDTLVLTDVLASEVTLYRPNTETYHKDDLLIQIAGLGVDGHFHIVDQFNGQDGKGIERLVFADGEVWTHADFLELAVLEGTNSGETLDGQSGRDNLFGLDGDDTLNGNDGDDHLYGGLGADTLNGGDGNDTYYWSKGDGNDIVRDLSTDTSETDTLVLEDVLSTDVRMTRGITSPELDLWIDVLSTGETVTVFQRFSNDYDGRGVEIIKFADGVVWTLDDIRAQTFTEGTTGNDTIIGKNYSDNLFGLEGDDILDAGLSDDHLTGGLGADTLRGDEGNDTYYWSKGDGNDTLDDEVANTSETDTLVLTDVESTDVKLSRVSGSTDLFVEIVSTGEVINVRRRYGDNNDGRGVEVITFSDGIVWTLEDIRANAVMEGTAASETFNGKKYDDNIWGFEGNDVLDGNAGDDYLVGGLGADTLRGDTGVDTISYRWAAQGVSVDLNNTGAQVGNAGGEEVGDVISGVDNIEGSSFDDDLRGQDVANVFWGYEGNDWLVGGGGHDELFGGSGDDGLIGGAGADYLDGGLGMDRVSYNDAAVGVRADLLDSSVNTRDALGDIYVSIENLRGSAFSDDLRGDESANILWGNTGNDILRGRGGDDVLVGESGADLLDGGDGFDSVIYSSSASAVLVALEDSIGLGGDAEGDLFISIEGVHGSAFDDTLIGDAGANYLNGNAGDDLLVGGKGNDAISGGAGADRFVYSQDDGSDTILDFELAADTIGFIGAGLTFGDLEISDTAEGAQVIYSRDGASQVTGQIVLENIAAASLTAAHLEFDIDMSVSGTSGQDYILTGGDADQIAIGYGTDLVSSGGNGDLIVQDLTYLDGKLLYEYYELGFSPNGVADIPTTGAAAVGVRTATDVNAISLVHGGDGDNYGVRFAGAVEITTAGDYLFETGSDDGSVLYVDGQLVVDNDGAHGMIYENGTINLSAGSHTIEVLFIERTGGDNLVVNVQGADTGGVSTELFASGLLGNAGDARHLVQEVGNLFVDTVHGWDGDDEIHGGIGDDHLVGGKGADTIHGEDGHDLIYGDTSVSGLLYYEYYELDSNYPTVELLPATGAFHTGSTDSIEVNAISLANGGDGETYGIRLGGVLVVETAGYYTLQTGSDDGSRVAINGNVVAVADGLHSMRFGEGTVFLETGQHDLEILFVEGGGTDNLLVTIQGPDTGDTATELVASGMLGDLETSATYIGDPAFSADTLYGGAGEDELHGGIGNDLIYGGDDVDLIYGDAGDDTLHGDDASDIIHGGAGTDTIYGGDGYDEIHGGAGNDLIYGAEGADTIYGGDGNDTIDGEIGWDNIYGGDGDDHITGGYGFDEIWGGDGNDTVFAGGQPDDVYGGNGDDHLDGGKKDDVIYGEAGDDDLYGGDDNDTLIGGIGADYHHGGSGFDFAGYMDATSGVLADLGDSSVNTGDAAGDTYTKIEGLHGSLFDDDLRGNGSANTLSGDDGNDILAGRLGNDILDGGAGDDTFIFEGGDDTVLAGSGTDTLQLDADFSDASFSLVGDDVLITLAEGTILLQDQLEFAVGASAEVTEYVAFNDTVLGEASIRALALSGGNVQEIDFNDPAHAVLAFSSQDAGQASVSPDGTTVTLTNNAWKQVQDSFVITADSVLRFEFSSDTEGEFHAIGFDTNNDISSSLTFQVSGIQDWAILDYDNQYVTGSGTQLYEIPVGEYFTGTYDRMTFIMDDDAGLGGDSSFSNIELL